MMITDISMFDLIRRNSLLPFSDSSEEIVVNSNHVLFKDIEGIQTEDIPVVIGKSFEMMENLEKQNNKAIEAAKKAERGADLAKEKSAGFAKKKAAIEALQNAGVDTAEALVDVIEAQKLSFGLHRQMAEITKYLFALGVGNLALNRSVVRELEAKLTGASAEQLSELAKAEVISVIRQLKAQEDVMLKQENMSASLKKHNGEITQLTKTDKKLENQLKTQAETIKCLDKELNNQSAINKQLEKGFKVQTETIKRIDKELTILAETDKKLDKDLKSQAETGKCLAEDLKKQVEIIEQLKKHLCEQCETINSLKDELQGFRKQVEEQNGFFNTFKSVFSKKVMVAYIIGGVGTLTGICSILFNLLT